LPAGLYIDEKDQIYVADQYNKKINIYQYLPEKPAASDDGTEGGDKPSS
jgi:hypothetical protein